MSRQILKLILEFKEDFITKDIILDKILSKGITSLTEFDKEILDNQNSNSPPPSAGASPPPSAGASGAA